MNPDASGRVPFLDFLGLRRKEGPPGTDEVLASVLPLFRQTVQAHEEGKVAPLGGAAEIYASGETLFFLQASAHDPRTRPSELTRIDRPAAGALDIVGEATRTLRVEEPQATVVNRRIGSAGQEVTRPVYLPGYQNWEEEVGHHDALTDTFSLGMVLSSVALGLDFSEPGDLERFVAHRENLFELFARLNPVVAKAIVRMTELSRHRRAPDLAAILRRLENYREQDFGEFETHRIKGFRESDLRGKRGLVLSRLRERLFEISRRNRLLYYRPSLGHLNLTLASVPLVLDAASIRPEQLFLWQPEVEKAISEARALPLGKYLRFEDAPYLPDILDRILAEARRDQAEFGFAQLRLVLCFLRWHNLKEVKEERIESPLLLLPVRLSKKKGVRDSYVLEPTGTLAEINPVLRHHLRQLYNIALPESVDLAETTMGALYERLAQQIHASEPGVTLHKIDRPRVDLIYDRARRRLDQYQRRLRLAGQGVRSYGEVDYSYRRENFQPLGLRLFQLKVRPSPAPLREWVADPSAPREYGEDPRWPRAHARPEESPGPVEERERRVAVFHQGSASNPYSWDFDLSSLTLGNFKYRRMSLVRDYEALLEEDLPNPAFDAIFSLVPRENAGPEAPAGPLEEQFPVVACDPTQASAIARSRLGRSLVIQGPPGTGKSQTITNLIADFVARGRRVLFVCEKRAALDVVFHRLKQVGLDELCTLIHDSQTDKKGFILDLKKTYETALKPPEGEADPEQERRSCLRSMREDLGPLERFDRAMKSVPPVSGVPLYELLHRRAEVEDAVPPLSTLEIERVPPYALWKEHRAPIDRLAASIGELQADRVFRHHPLHRLHPDFARVDRPTESVLQALENVRTTFQKVERFLRSAGFPRETCDEFGEAAALVEYAARLAPLAQRNLLPLLDPASVSAQEFARATAEQRRRAQALAAAREATRGWRKKLPAQEVGSAVDLAKDLERSFLPFLRPSWWRLRGILSECYDFSSHVLKPRWRRILEELEQEHRAADEFDRSEKAFAERYGSREPSSATAERIEALRILAGSLQGVSRRLHDRVLASPEAVRIVGTLAEGREPLDALLRQGEALLSEFGRLTFGGLEEEIQRLESSLDQLPDFLPCLADLAQLPPPLVDSLREQPWTLAQLEAAMAERSVREAVRSDRFLAGFGGKLRDRHARRLDGQYRAWLRANARCLLTRVCLEFRRRALAPPLPDSKLTEGERAARQSYSAGRRDLEHEFGKTMRYKSIRELLAKKSGDVIVDMKPVWLMSPLSVSDTLPLDVERFDAVIFDEASQIPLEEAIPSVFRAKQIIVVGDEMQLPPTNFFSAKRPGDSALLAEDEREEPEVVEYDLDSDSFLNHACRTLPSALLGWHYRSRSEALICFSNAFFYRGELLTVPDRELPPPDAGELGVERPEDAEPNAGRLLERSLSFHALRHGLYLDRRNEPEAAYIAHLVRSLLRRRAGLSLGIVAFSEAQQDQIERALDKLAKTDGEFREALEAESEREEDGQFVGLLVKNLENIQGDERDVIILSICYGFGPDGRMLMNFGPINQSGGEKRLNVAFSRAKRHMAVVSSIRHGDVRNVYNAGARCLKGYLHFAELASAGDRRAARRLLESHAADRDTKLSDYREAAVTRQLSEALRAKGYLVESGLGQSKFRCDLAVRRKDEPSYRAAILVDTPEYYRQPDLMERELLRPRVLRAFGWEVFHLLTKDWVQDRAGVLDRLEKLLEGTEAEPPEELPNPPAPEAPAPEEPTSRTEGLEPVVLPPESARPPEAPSEASVPELLRYFECVEGGSSKFWEITVRGASIHVRFGRIGTEGQGRSKTLAHPILANREAQAMIREKLGRGYKEKER
jgi:predicted DNA-binding WGR domain protein